jgi:nucleotide-binding universal stress UspA family protein
MIAPPPLGSEDSASTVRRPLAQAVFHRLLVPIDFSSAARRAFETAMAMHDQWGSAVVLFYAPGMDGNDEFLDYTGVPWGASDVLQEGRGQLERFADTLVPGSGAKIHIDVRRADDPVGAVVSACERHEPSLIVLGTHARDRRRWTRSRAERITRAVPCPVLLVRGEPEGHADADE